MLRSIQSIFGTEDYRGWSLYNWRLTSKTKNINWLFDLYIDSIENYKISDYEVILSITSTKFISAIVWIDNSNNFTKISKNSDTKKKLISKIVGLI